MILNNRNIYIVCICCALLTMANHESVAATGAEMKACEIAVLEKPKFQDLPMAAVSVYPGK